ncbi:hypothetical protein [Nocardiopsis quinghaiensis]|uniref:hypothetical protein n=1 Tax=Nocardiopsis quinghaiensis TaxID=464995 RepID=UPI00123C6EC7|nr:hypothetical protein [Nocardiopsis quinghaiensis]
MVFTVDEIQMTEGGPYGYPFLMNMSERLLRSAQRWAISSLDFYIDTPSDHMFSIHHMGVSVEHASKAYLASVSTVLLAPDRPSVDDLLVLSGNEDKTQKGVEGIRTAAGETVISRTTNLLRKSRGNSDSVRMLREARNGITHLGVWDQGSGTKELLASGITYIDEILAALSRTEGWFWRNHEGLSRRILEDTESEVNLRYKEKIQRAKGTFQMKVGHLPADQKKQVIVSLEAIPVSSRWHMSIPTYCPACGSLGVASGRDHLEDYGAWFSPRHFGCRVCDLVLDGLELRLAGITGHAIDEIDEDPDWEPDNESM